MGRSRGALEGKGPQRRPQKRLDRRLEEVAKAIGGGYCRLQMPLRLALAVRGTVAGHRLDALEGGGGLPCPPSNASSVGAVGDWPEARAPRHTGRGGGCAGSRIRWDRPGGSVRIMRNAPGPTASGLPVSEKAGEGYHAQGGTTGMDIIPPPAER